jgi:hypothetical protein
MEMRVIIGVTDFVGYVSTKLIFRALWSFLKVSIRLTIARPLCMD